MSILMYITRTTLYYVIDITLLLMFIRAILSWLGPGAGGKAGMFIRTVTEYVIAPVRSILSRFEWTNSLPIDISFTVTFVLLAILQGILF